MIGLAVLGVLYWMARRREDHRPRRRFAPGDVDRDVLEAAEREVRDLSIDHHPDEGFEGDDWGPGAARQDRGHPGTS
jgi:hypothetical protein